MEVGRVVRAALGYGDLLDDGREERAGHRATCSGKVAEMRTDAATAQRKADLNRRLRLSFLAGAEGRSRQALGRPLTDEELRRVIARYPGDVADR